MHDALIYSFFDRLFEERTRNTMSNKQSTSHIVVFAVDDSGSTSGSHRYWSKVESIFNSIKDTTHENILWSDKANCVDDNFMDVAIQKRSLYGGSTRISALAQSLINNHKDLSTIKLVLISDGQVSDGEVRAADQTLNGASFAEVNVHFIKTGGEINLSVSSPFTRNTEFTVSIDDENLVKAKSNQKIDLTAYSDPDVFLNGYTDLKSSLVAQNMGRVNTEMRKQVLNLQTTLMASLSKQESQGMTETFAVIHDALKANSVDLAQDVLKSVMNKTDTNKGKEVEKKIADLLKVSENGYGYAFSAYCDAGVPTSRYDRASLVESQPVAEIEHLDVGQTFECPIMMDSSHPVLLLVDYGSTGLSADVLEEVTNCPLNLIKYPEVVNKIVTGFDHVVGLDFIQKGLPSESPYSRQRVIGALTLGPDEKHCKASNWSMARLISSGRLMGNPDLWLLTFYYIIKQHCPRLAENKELMAAFEEQLVYRLEKHKTRLGLSGLPDYPLVRAPVGIALWYSFVGSTLLYANDANNFKQERLREYYPVVDVAMQGLQLLGYPCLEEIIRERAAQLRAFGFLMANKDTRDNISDLIRAQYQNHILKTEVIVHAVVILMIAHVERIIFLDGPLRSEPPKLPLPLQGIPINILLRLLELADPSKKVGDVALAMPLEPLEPVVSKNYSYSHEGSSEATVLCPATMRPYFMDLKKSKEWFHCAEEAFGKDFLSAYNYYIRFVYEQSRFPNEDELIIYMANKEANKASRPRDTLPAHVEVIAKEVIDNYNQVKGEMSVDDFYAITQKSCPRQERLNMEELYVMSIDLGKK